MVWITTSLELEPFPKVQNFSAHSSHHTDCRNLQRTFTHIYFQGGYLYFCYWINLHTLESKKAEHKGVYTISYKCKALESWQLCSHQWSLAFAIETAVAPNESTQQFSLMQQGYSSAYFPNGWRVCQNCHYKPLFSGFYILESAIKNSFRLKSDIKGHKGWHPNTFPLVIVEGLWN